MNSSLDGVLLGLLLLFLGIYFLISLFTLIYLKVALGLKFKFKNLLSLLIISFAWVFLTLLAFLLTATAGILIFGLFALILIFAAVFFFAHRFLFVDPKHKIVYSLTLAGLFNPAWLFIFGIIS